MKSLHDPSKQKKEERMLLEYLRQIIHHRDAIKKRLFIFQTLTESENEMREALTFQRMSFDESGVIPSPTADQKFFRVINDYSKEKKNISTEIKQMKDTLTDEIRLLYSVKNAVLSLSEPQRSIFLLRYFEKSPWNVVQKRIGKSSSYTFQLHTEGLKVLLSSLGKENSLLLTDWYTKNHAFTMSDGHASGLFALLSRDRKSASGAFSPYV